MTIIFKLKKIRQLNKIYRANFKKRKSIYKIDFKESIVINMNIKEKHVL